MIVLFVKDTATTENNQDRHTLSQHDALPISVQSDGAEALAQAARAAGAGAFVHVSAIGADPHSRSRYGRTKGEGEARVLAASPGATIIRPSVLFGPEDDFIKRFARTATLLLRKIESASRREKVGRYVW